MVKMWAKTIKDEKITRSIIFETPEKYTSSNFFQYMTAICQIFDVPTPVVLKYHTANFEQFNICKFVKRDFVETTDFDILVIENAQ